LVRKQNKQINQSRLVRFRVDFSLKGLFIIYIGISRFGTMGYVWYRRDSGKEVPGIEGFH